jgi:hypothetical protein
MGKCPSGQMSFWAIVFWANFVPVKCLWANVFGQMSLGKCLLGKCRIIVCGDFEFKIYVTVAGFVAE